MKLHIIVVHDVAMGNLVKALVWALFGQMLKLWQRSRWTDAELSINWVGLGLAFHGALIEIIPVWVDCIAKKRRPAVADFAVRPAAAAQQEVAEALAQPADAHEQAVALTANGAARPICVSEVQREVSNVCGGVGCVP